VSLFAQPTIHLLDDDDAVRESLRILLEAHAFKVRDYGSAEEFLRSFRGDQSGCLILDLHLPIVGGLDLIRILRERLISIPVVFITGGSDRDIRRRALDGGAVAFLDKPVGEEPLLAAIRSALASAAAPRLPRPASVRAVPEFPGPAPS